MNVRFSGTNYIRSSHDYITALNECRYYFPPVCSVRCCGHERLNMFCLGGACAFLPTAEDNDTQSPRPKHAENLVAKPAFILMANSSGSDLSSAERGSLYPSCGNFYPEGLQLLAKVEGHKLVKPVASLYPEGGQGVRRISNE